MVIQELLLKYPTVCEMSRQFNIVTAGFSIPCFAHTNVEPPTDLTRVRCYILAASPHHDHSCFMSTRLPLSANSCDSLLYCGSSPYALRVQTTDYKRPDMSHSSIGSKYSAFKYRHVFCLQYNIYVTVVSVARQLSQASTSDCSRFMDLINTEPSG